MCGLLLTEGEYSIRKDLFEGGLLFLPTPWKNFGRPDELSGDFSVFDAQNNFVYFIRPLSIREVKFIPAGQALILGAARAPGWWFRIQRAVYLLPKLLYDIETDKTLSTVTNTHSNNYGQHNWDSTCKDKPSNFQIETATIANITADNLNSQDKDDCEDGVPHNANESRINAATDGPPIADDIVNSCLNVSHLDAVVPARSTFELNDKDAEYNPLEVSQTPLEVGTLQHCVDSFTEVKAVTDDSRIVPAVIKRVVGPTEVNERLGVCPFVKPQVQSSQIESYVSSGHNVDVEKSDHSSDEVLRIIEDCSVDKSANHQETPSPNAQWCAELQVEANRVTAHDMFPQISDALNSHDSAINSGSLDPSAPREHVPNSGVQCGAASAAVQIVERTPDMGDTEHSVDSGKGCAAATHTDMRNGEHAADEEKISASAVDEVCHDVEVRSVSLAELNLDLSRRVFPDMRLRTHNASRMSDETLDCGNVRTVTPKSEVNSVHAHAPFPSAARTTQLKRPLLNETSLQSANIRTVSQPASPQSADDKPRWAAIWDKRGWKVVELDRIDVEGYNEDNGLPQVLLSDWTNLASEARRDGRYASDYGRDRDTAVTKKQVLIRYCHVGPNAEYAEPVTEEVPFKPSHDLESLVQRNEVQRQVVVSHSSHQETNDSSMSTAAKLSSPYAVIDTEDQEGQPRRVGMGGHTEHHVDICSDRIMNMDYPLVPEDESANAATESCSTAATESCSTAATESCSTAATESCSTAATESCSTAATESCSTAATESCSTAATESCSTAATESCSTAATESCS
eukprot:Lankesteria_metandrocarpae@DN3712_c0_g1_i4.p2